jgi:hypothetical protein
MIISAGPIAGAVRLRLQAPYPFPVRWPVRDLRESMLVQIPQHALLLVLAVSFLIGTLLTSSKIDRYLGYPLPAAA